MPLIINDQQTLLTPKEVLVLDELAHGYSKKEIAARFFRAESTVKTHIEHIKQKLGSRNAPHLVFLAIDKGLFTLLPCFLVVIVVFNVFAAGFSMQRPMRRPVSVVRVAMRRPVERFGRALG